LGGSRSTEREGNNMSEYVPFGDEWKKHVAKLPKRELVEMLVKALREKQEIQVELFREQQSRPTKRAVDRSKRSKSGAAGKA